jgi:5-aminopentanamidase
MLRKASKAFKMPTICVLELPAAYVDPVQWQRLDQALARVPGGALVLLPECCLTGYVSPTGNFDLTPYAEESGGVTCQRLAAAARRHRITLIGPWVERAANACFNTLVGFDEAGQRVVHYRKRHPWYPETWATPGAEPYPRWQWRGLWLTAAICFDLHFLQPDGAPLDQADVLLFASAWVDETDSRTPMLTALSRQHRLVVANANWGAGTPRLPGQGGSCIVTPERLLASDEGLVMIDLPDRAEQRPSSTS